MCIYIRTWKVERRGVTVIPGTAKDCSCDRNRFLLLAEKVESFVCVRVCIGDI